MPRIGLLFPGQGAQKVGMGKELTSRSVSARELYDSASVILGYDLLELSIVGPDEKLSATEYSQPALFVHSMAALASLAELHRDVLDSVVAVAGLSLGEYSALAAAKAISFQDGVRLVQARGQNMQRAADLEPSGMASVIGLSREDVLALCDRARLPDEVLQPANILCPGNIAISGHLASLKAAESMAESMGARLFQRLNVAGAFHTKLMEPASDGLLAALKQAAFTESRLPVFSNVDAKPHSSPLDFTNLLAKQITSPVEWEASLRNMIEFGVEQFYEVGCGRVLAGTLKRIDRSIPCECIGD